LNSVEALIVFKFLTLSFLFWKIWWDVPSSLYLQLQYKHESFHLHFMSFQSLLEGIDSINLCCSQWVAS